MNVTYPPRLFVSDDIDEALEIARLACFATIMPMDGTLADAVFAPFVVDGAGEAAVLKAHLLRTNPWRELLAAGPVEARLVFNAADGYVSPSIYAEKARSGKVVPTWNYVAAQFAGEMEAVPDEALMDQLDLQVRTYEAAMGSGWALEDAPADYRAKMAQAIFGIRFTPRRWRAHRKLMQNKPAERAGLLAWAERPAPAPRTMAHWMKAAFE